MIVAGSGLKVVVATRPVDFRKGHDGLAAVVEHELGLDPYSGIVFVFRPKRVGLAAARARGKKLGRQPGQRPKSDRLAPKVLHAIDGGRSYHWIARDLGISKNTVADIVKRHRETQRRISPPTGLDPHDRPLQDRAGANVVFRLSPSLSTAAGTGPAASSATVLHRSIRACGCATAGNPLAPASNSPARNWVHRS